MRTQTNPRRQRDIRRGETFFDRVELFFGVKERERDVSGRREDRGRQKPPHGREGAGTTVDADRSRQRYRAGSFIAGGLGRRLTFRAVL
jgi:hypothetical protein